MSEKERKRKKGRERREKKINGQRGLNRERRQEERKKVEAVHFLPLFCSDDGTAEHTPPNLVLA